MPCQQYTLSRFTSVPAPCRPHHEDRQPPSRPLSWQCALACRRLGRLVILRQAHIKIPYLTVPGEVSLMAYSSGPLRASRIRVFHDGPQVKTLGSCRAPARLPHGLGGLLICRGPRFCPLRCRHCPRACRVFSPAPTSMKPYQCIQDIKKWF